MAPPSNRSATRRPGPLVRVDMHVHTMWSGDSTTTPEELAEAVARASLDVVCITDHHTIAGAQELAGRLPCRVVVGQECRTAAGELIGLFLSARVPPGLSPAQVAEVVHDQGGLVYVPHPFDPHRHRLRDEELSGLASSGALDAVEVLNAKTPPGGCRREAASFAQRWGLPAGAGSDAHVPAAIGAACVEMEDFHDARSFLAALRSPRASVTGRHFDPPRRWAPRVVPSTRS